MFNEKFKDVISKEGPVAIVTSGSEEPHVSCTWNSYLTIAGTNRLLIPVGGMNKTQKNIEVNNKVQLTCGAREVMGKNSMGTGFHIKGTAKFLSQGPDYETVKAKFPWLRAALEITVDSATQTL